MLIFEKVDNLAKLYQTKIFLKELTNFYPEIIHWFWNSVLPTILNGNSNIYFVYLNNELIGFFIIKNEIEEKKIRTIYLMEKYRNKGFINKFFNFILNELKIKNPKFSVPEELIDIYLKIIKKFNFKITNIIQDKYRKNKIEYFVN